MILGNLDVQWESRIDSRVQATGLEFWVWAPVSNDGDGEGSTRTRFLMAPRDPAGL